MNVSSIPSAAITKMNMLDIDRSDHICALPMQVWSPLAFSYTQAQSKTAGHSSPLASTFLTRHTSFTAPQLLRVQPWCCFVQLRVRGRERAPYSLRPSMLI